MRDHSCMQITVSDGPGKRRPVGKLPSGSLAPAAPSDVTAGETSTGGEISPGGLAALAGGFDAECSGAGQVVPGRRRVSAVTEAGSRHGYGYLAHDTVLGLHALEVRPHCATAWEECPGPAKMTQAASGIPWLLDSWAAAAPCAKHRAWEILDRECKEASGTRQELPASGHGRSTG